MEVIRFDGYTTDEKVSIGRGYLWPRQVERNGLAPEDVTIERRRAAARGQRLHPRGGRPRSSSAQLGTVLRKTATRIASGDAAEADR